jgi:uncharacterized protein
MRAPLVRMPQAVAAVRAYSPAVDGTTETDWRRPSPRLMLVRRLEVLVPTFLAALGVGIAGAASSARTGAIAAAVALGIGALMLVFVSRRVRAWSYAERDEDLLVRRGVLFSRLSVVPYGRMQFIDVTAGPIERSFGLATVRLHTAAAASDARIPGLSRDEAARLRDSLAELGEAQAAGL